jgi:hypothetical protein
MSRSLSESQRVTLAGEIAALQSPDVDELRMCWRNHYGNEAPARFLRARNLMPEAAGNQQLLCG